MKFLVKLAGNEAEFNSGLCAAMWVHEFDIKKLLEIVRRSEGYVQVDYDYTNNDAESVGDGNEE